MSSNNHRMYQGVRTWSPFVGCEFHCAYCIPSFQRTVNRVYHCQGGKCVGCRDFKPHEHRNRLNSIPPGQLIWSCAHGDISFADPDFIRQIIQITKNYPDREFLWQSKNPACFSQFLSDFTKNTILLTTLETNRDKNYRNISKAPLPSKRAQDFKALKWQRKIITVEPILDFDSDRFLKTITDINPEAVFIGYNSKPKFIRLPEPSLAKTTEFIIALQENGILVKKKLLR